MKRAQRSRTDVFVYVKGISIGQLGWLVRLLLVISGGWLLFLGQWQYLILALAAGICFPLLYKLMTWPVRQVIPALLQDILRKKRLAVLLLGFISSVYTGALLTIWVITVHHFAFAPSTPDALIPLILLGYGCVVGAVVFGLENKAEDKDLGVSFLLSYTSTLYIALALMAFLGIALGQWIALPVVVFAMINTSEELALSRKKKVKILNRNAS